jgi:4-amino-4-deoxy-L-arabinose transferase-like glycosyltransferase
MPSSSSPSDSADKNPSAGAGTSTSGKPALVLPSLLVLLGAGLLMQLLLGASVHLSPDEAHYALYGSRPDWSYFDHPPLVGWVQIPFAALGGADFLMRLVPSFCWLLAAVMLWRWVPRWLAASATGESAPGGAAGSDAWLGGCAVVLLLSAPLLNLLGLALVPDTLLLPLCLGVMALTWRLRAPDQAPQLRLWALLGLLLGLCGLSKYTAVFIGIGALAALGSSHRWRLFALPGFWLALVLALASITPVIYWNVVHDWISFTYQTQHAAGTREWKLGRVLATVLIQVICYGPLLAVTLGVGVARLWRAGRGDESNRPAVPGFGLLGFVACFAAPAATTALLLSGRGSSLPHWTAYMWVVCIPVAVVGARHLSTVAPRLLRALLALQVVCVLLLVTAMLSGGPFAETGSQAKAKPGESFRAKGQVNPITDLYGWEVAARQAQVLAKAQGIEKLAVRNWSLASRVAWYARPWPVYVVPGRRGDQFELWFGTLQRGDSAIVIDFSAATAAPPVAHDLFARCVLLAQTPVIRWGRQISHFNHMRCDGWRMPSDERAVATSEGSR